MIVTITGHRSEDCETEDIVRAKFAEAFESYRIDAVCCGMANGVDLWAGDEALRAGIPVWAARPWSGHGPRREDVDLYARIIAGAERVVNVTEVEEYPGPWVYHKRNEWMVDNSTHVLAYWNGKKSGGTFACLKYAIKTQTPIRNVYGN